MQTASVKKHFKPALHNVEAANLGVTVAVDEARKRGFLRRSDMKGMSHVDCEQYMRLARIEWGVTEYDPTEPTPREEWHDDEED